VAGILCIDIVFVHVKSDMVTVFDVLLEGTLVGTLRIRSVRHGEVR
jgi:hypothetical protein